MKRRVPYAVGSYEKVVRNHEYYFVDHTRYIRELEKHTTPVCLRPRRFGKTLWCSMLECYYDVKRKARFTELFGQMDIGRAPTALRNSFLVLRFNFSCVGLGTVDEIRGNFDEHVRLSVRSFSVYYSDFADFSAVAKEGLTAQQRIDGLLSILKDNPGLPRLYVIIDEYDNFTNQLVTAKRDEDYAALTGNGSFLKNFFKSLKAGVEVEAIGRTYITGVLPITLDDLTSGFNIAKPVMFEPELLGMLGFTQRDVEKYVDEVFADYELNPELKPRTLADLKALYDSYRFLPEQDEPLYNSTILNYYLDEFTLHPGIPPDNPIDGNLTTDIGWIERLAGSSEAALEDVRKIVERDGLFAVERSKLSPQQFNKAAFFRREYFAIALYYLGLLTFRENGRLGVPNLVVRRMFMDYYEVLERNVHWGIDDVYGDVVDAFKATHDWRAFFQAYWKLYVGKIPARLFGNLTEAFFQISFCDLCQRMFYKQWYFMLEPNLHSGLADLVALPKLGTGDGLNACVIEFKYAKRGTKAVVTPKMKRQVAAYAAELKAKYPAYEVEAYVASIVGRKSVSFVRVRA